MRRVSVEFLPVAIPSLCCVFLSLVHVFLFPPGGCKGLDKTAQVHRRYKGRRLLVCIPAAPFSLLNLFYPHLSPHLFHAFFTEPCAIARIIQLHL